MDIVDNQKQIQHARWQTHHAWQNNLSMTPQFADIYALQKSIGKFGYNET
jgi:hypothetical protein